MNRKHWMVIGLLFFIIATAFTVPVEAKTRVNVEIGAFLGARTPCYYPRREIVGYRYRPNRVVVYEAPRVYREREVVVVKERPRLEVSKDLPFVQEVYNKGEIIKLNDGSLWSVSEADARITGRWMRYDSIEVARSKSRSAPFKLINSTTGEEVKAHLKRQ
jgi:hypothetical protein